MVRLWSSHAGWACRGDDMVPRCARSALALALLATTIAGCSARSQAHLPVTARPPNTGHQSIPAPPPPPAQDPIATLVATSQRHFDSGQQELLIGHLERARIEFCLLYTSDAADDLLCVDL